MDTQEAPIPDRFLPPESEPVSRRRIVRWSMTLFALVVLVMLAYKAYFWFVEDVSRRETLAVTGGYGDPADDIGGAASNATAAINPPVIVPTVVPGISLPAATVDFGNIDDPDQRRSVCAYLAAERERLDHEFVQPLPPPVIDRIATETAQLQAQAGRYDCALAQQQSTGNDAASSLGARDTPANRATTSPGEIETE